MQGIQHFYFVSVGDARHLVCHGAWRLRRHIFKVQVRKEASTEDAISVNRRIMGATDPKEAAPGTIRADFAESIDANAVHGSDSDENAKIEGEFHFAEEEVI